MDEEVRGVAPVASLKHIGDRDRLALDREAGRDDLLLLTVDLTVFGDELVWEPSRGGQMFPHLYAPLPVAAITASRAFSVSAEGEMIFGDAA